MEGDRLDIDFIQKCRKMDFSSESVNKERNLELLKTKLYQTNEREIVMKKKTRKPFVIAALAAAVVVCTGVVYGDDLFKVIKEVQIGSMRYSVISEESMMSNNIAATQSHATSNDAEDYAASDTEVTITYNQSDNTYDVAQDESPVTNPINPNESPAPVTNPINPNDFPVPEQLMGQVFDKDGNVIQAFSDHAILYNADGEEARMSYDGGNDVWIFRTDEEAAAAWFSTTDQAEANDYFITDTLSPSYLPAGYSFDRAELMSDSPTLGAEKYMNRYYTNGEDAIFCQVRFMDEETAVETSIVGDADDLQKTKINGNDAVIMGHTLDILVGDVMYMFSTADGMEVDELVKIAESLK